MTTAELISGAELGAEVRACVASTVSAVARADSPLQRLAGGPGQQLRASLVLESARASSRSFAWRDVIHLGAAVELLHLGSLVHDDVVDGARLRRGVDVAVRDEREAETRLLEGLACAHAALDLVLRTSQAYAGVFASRLPALATGQVLDAQRVGRTLSAAELVDVHAHKTGALFAVAIELGLVASQAASRRRLSMARAVGSSLGVTYQFIDDCRELLGADTAKSARDRATGRDLFAVGRESDSVTQALEIAGGSLAAAEALWNECFGVRPEPAGAFARITAMLEELREA
jgi:geranylgeranyl pyrophosphate synthase